MTSREFNAALALLGWSVKRAADRLGKHTNTISKYKNGQYTIPPPVQIILRLELKNPDNFRNYRNPKQSMQYLLTD